jgi:hypothetical protein
VRPSYRPQAGWLEKRGRVNVGWKRRWHVLERANHPTAALLANLMYFDSDAGGPEQGRVEIGSGASVTSGVVREPKRGDMGVAEVTATYFINLEVTDSGDNDDRTLRGGREGGRERGEEKTDTETETHRERERDRQTERQRDV